MIMKLTGLIGGALIVVGLFAWADHETSNHLMIAGCALIVISKIGERGGKSESQ